MTLTEFLLARIAEDEARATDARRLQDYMPYGAWDLDRVLVECEAKRRIVERLRGADDFGDPAHNEPAEVSGFLVDELLRILALPHADHPDYDESWRP